MDMCYELRLRIRIKVSVDAITKSIWLIASIMASFFATFHQTPLKGNVKRAAPRNADNFLTRQLWVRWGGSFSVY